MEKKIEKSPEEKVIKSTYLKTGLPSDIEEELKRVLKCDSLKLLKGVKLAQARNDINSKITSILSNEKYSELFKSPKNGEYIDAKSLTRYFAGESIREDKLNLLKIFLDYSPEKLVLMKNEQQSRSVDNIYSPLLGAWNSYVYDEVEPTSNKVKRTVLFLNRRNSQFLDVQYESLRGRFNGTGEILNNSLLINLKSIDKKTHIFLCAELPDFSNYETSNELILNVSCLSNSLSGKPVNSNVIMTKNKSAVIDFGNPDTIQNYLETKSVPLLYTDNILGEKRKVSSNILESDWKEKEIILYLCRNKNRNTRLSSFSPNSFDQIVQRNIQAFKRKGNENYDRLKLKLQGHVFYAFNRFRQNRNEVAIFSYTFEFKDQEKQCLAVRHPISNSSKIEFYGETYLEAEMICMIMRDDNGQRRKQYIAPFNCAVNDDSKTFVFKGITSSISSLNKNPMALRELIVCIPENNVSLINFEYFSDLDKANGFVSYKAFRELPSTILKIEEKLFLANQSMSILTFPNKSDTTYIYYRLDKARKYKGCYHLYTYSTNTGVKPLHMELTIDSLSEVILKIKYTSDPDDEDIYTYHGVCEFFNNSLRIGVHFSSDYPNDEKHSEFIFDPIIEKDRQSPEVLTGMNLTTGNGNKAMALNFLAIKDDWLAKNGEISKSVRKENHSGLENIGLVTYDELNYLQRQLKKHGIDSAGLSDYLIQRKSFPNQSTDNK